MSDELGGAAPGREPTAAELLAVLGAVREGIVVHGPDGRIEHANDAALRILGLTFDQLLGRDSFDPQWRATRPDGSQYHGRDHPAMVALRTGEAVVDELMGVELPDGARRWIRVSARPIDDRPVGERRVVATFVDVTAERERERRYRTLAESTTDLVARVDDHVVAYASPAAEVALGGLVGRPARAVATEHAHPDDLLAFMATMDRISRGEATSEHLDMRLRTLDRGWRWFDVRVWRTADVGGLVVVARDVTQRTSMERELADAEELFRQAFEEAPIGMAMTSIDDEAVVVRTNRRFADALGHPVDEVVGLSAYSFTHVEDRDASAAARARLLSGESTHERMHVRVVRSDGSRWHVLTRTLLRDQAGAPRFVLAQLEDASAAHDIVSELAVLAHTDPLTGLANRRGLEAELATVLADPYALAHSVVFFLDLDGFKAVNDRLGHHAGDEVLRRVGERIALLTRSHDTVARVGGDEFVVVARHVSANSASQVAARLRAPLLEVPGDPALSIGASVGVAWPVAGDTATSVIDRADRDMYRHKHRAEA